MANTRSQALDALGAALKAAERTIYARNYGVAASVPMGGGLALEWCKVDRNWGLYVKVTTHFGSRLAEAQATHRILAAAHLEALAAELERTHTLEVSAIDAATSLAEAFK